MGMSAGDEARIRREVEGRIGVIQIPTEWVRELLAEVTALREQNGVIVERPKPVPGMYRLYAGRWIYRGDAPLIKVEIPSPRMQPEDFDPSDVDRALRLMVDILNGGISED
jgi:hypothetical protein